MQGDEAVADMLSKLSSEGGGPKTRMVSCMCGDLIPEGEAMKTFYSGIVNYRLPVCDNCLPDFRKFFRVVCLGCKGLVGVDYAQQDSKTKFKFEAGKSYHVRECPACKEKCTHASVIEHERWCRERGIVTRQDFDRQKEAEEKYRQAEKMAAALRAEIENTP